MTSRRLTHASRRFILGVIIALNTVLIAHNLFGLHDTSAALVNFFASCAAWAGVYFVNWAERLELSRNKERETGEEYDDDE